MIQTLSLDAIGLRHGTDKASSYHDYLNFYETYFQPLRHRDITILEIGVLGGASLRTWEEYFPLAKIVGADIDPATKAFEGGRTQVEIVDQSDAGQLARLALTHGPFDIVIEDGSHLWEHQITSLKALFPYVRPDGLYVVEDLWTNYGEMGRAYQGSSPITCMDYLKQWADIKVGDEAIDLAGIPDPFLQTHGRAVDSIIFNRRVCLLRKRAERHRSGGDTDQSSDALAAGPFHVPVTITGHVGFVGDLTARDVLNAAEDHGDLEGISLATVPGVLEYRVRAGSDAWSGWVSEGSFVGTRGEAKELTGIGIRLRSADRDGYTLRLTGRFAGQDLPVDAGNGEDCVGDGGAALRGAHIRLQRRSRSARGGRIVERPCYLTPFEIFDAEPCIETHRDLLYAPVGGAVPWQHDPGWGLYSRDGALIDAAAYYQGPGRRRFGGSSQLPSVPAVPEIAPPARYLYGGYIIQEHYGHFLLNALARLWPALHRDLSDWKIVCHGASDPDHWLRQDFVRDLLAAVGITRRNIVMFRRPTLIPEIEVPCPALVENIHVHRNYATLGHLVGNTLLRERNIVPSDRPVWLAKTRIASGIQRLVNEDEVTALLEARGVEIVHPQEMTLAEQAELFRVRPIIMGPVGSAFHTSILQPPRARCACICAGHAVHANFGLIDQANGNNIRYVMPEIELVAHEETQPREFMMEFRLVDPQAVADNFLRFMDEAA